MTTGVADDFWAYEEFIKRLQRDGTNPEMAQMAWDEAQQQREWAAFSNALDALTATVTENLIMAGDGNGGAVLAMVWEAFGQFRMDLRTPNQKARAERKRKIPQGLRTQVFERDAYRCIRCGDHHDLCADHIYPESKGGEATLENLQTLCRLCNSIKGATVEQ